MNTIYYLQHCFQLLPKTRPADLFFYSQRSSVFYFHGIYKIEFKLCPHFRSVQTASFIELFWKKTERDEMKAIWEYKSFCTFLRSSYIWLISYYIILRQITSSLLISQRDSSCSTSGTTVVLQLPRTQRRGAVLLFRSLLKRHTITIQINVRSQHT